MDHIPVGEIASQLPMFIDPTMIVDNVLAGYWDAADALGNSPYVGDPEGLWERKRVGAAHGRLHRGRPQQPRPRLLGRSGLRRRHRRPRTTSALRRRERCTMPRRLTPMCRAPMCGPRTWLTDQSHEMGDGRPRCLPRSRQRWPAPPRRVRPERHLRDRAPVLRCCGCAILAPSQQVRPGDR
jgi:hypothetical protein